MPDPRNTLRRFINSPRVTAGSALGFATATLLVACSTDGVTGPGAARAAAVPEARIAAGKSEDDSIARFRADSIKYAAEAAKDAAKTAAKAEKDLAKAQLDSLKADWDAYKRAVQRKEVKATVLRCEPQPRVSATKVVGPKGGSIKIGPHSLVVPAGALDSNVTITGTAPPNPSVNVEFAPHGLQFNRAVEMTIDYKQCIVPETVELGVTYMLNGWYPVQKMPSSDLRKDKKITALTDHFSGFVVTWGVRSAVR